MPGRARGNLENIIAREPPIIAVVLKHAHAGERSRHEPEYAQGNDSLRRVKSYNTIQPINQSIKRRLYNEIFQ